MLAKHTVAKWFVWPYSRSGGCVLRNGTGATVIEKHFVLDRSAGGRGCAAFLVETRGNESTGRSFVVLREAALGSVTYGGSDAEQAAKKYRRSIYLRGDRFAGALFLSETHLKIIRPCLVWRQNIGPRCNLEKHS